MIVYTIACCLIEELFGHCSFIYINIKFIREMCTQSNEAYNAVKKSRETDDDYEAVLEVEQYPLPPSTPSLPLHTTT